jgi:mRNA interferase MazF
MTAYKRGDIVLIPFPFSDQTTIKKRPAVIVTTNNYNNASLDIVIMAITIQTEQSFGIGECLIRNWREAGLLKPSSIKPAIATVEQKLVLKNLGKLSPEDLLSMDNMLRELLDLGAK